MFKDYCQSTSLHGFSYLYGNNKLAVKFFWLFVILAMTGIGILFIVLNTQQFLEARIETTIETSTAPLSVRYYWSALDFWKVEFEKSRWTNLMFCLFRTWFLLPAKFKFKIAQKWSSSKSIFWNPFFKNQVQINRVKLNNFENN